MRFSSPMTAYFSWFSPVYGGMTNYTVFSSRELVTSKTKPVPKFVSYRISWVPYQPPRLVSRTGSTPQRVSFLDRCQLTKYGLQIPPRFDEFILPSIMHKRSYNVFGRIDFFSVIRFLIVSLGDTLKLEWVLLSPELCEVIFSYRHCSSFENVIWFESYLLVKAIRTCLILGFSKKAKSFTFSGGPCAFRS